MRRPVGGGAAALATTIVLGLLSGCSFLKVYADPEVWDRHPNSGPLEVYGAESSTSGRLIYEELRRQAGLAEHLGSLPEPDTIEVLGRRFVRKRIKLNFTRSAVGRPYCIIIDQSASGFVPLPREKCRMEGRRGPPPEPAWTPPPKQQPVRTRAAPTPTPRRTPSPAEMLECPIDPKRQSCRRYCEKGAPYEWCR